MKLYNKGISWLGQFGILICVIGVGFVLATILSYVLMLVTGNADLFRNPEALLKPERLSLLLWIQILTTVFAFLVPAVAFAFICYRNGWDYLGFTGKVNAFQLISVVTLAVTELPLIGALGELNKAIPIPAGWRLRFDAMEKSYTDQISMIAQVNSWKDYFISLFVIALLPALVEEALFRAALQNQLVRWMKSPWAGILVASILFSAIHLSWYGFIPRLLLGIILGALFYYSRSIWPSILAHFINNGLVVTSLFIAHQRGQKVDISAEDHFPVWVVAGSVVLVIAAFTWFIHSSNPEPAEEVIFDENNPFLDDVA